MGLIPTMFRASSSELTPVVPPVGVYREHIAAHPVSLVLREKGWSMSGDDFSIKDAITGKQMYKCHGKAMSMHDRKKIYDNSGKMLYNLAEKLMSLHKTTVGEGAHGKEVLRVKKRWSKGSKLKATFVDADDKEHTVELRGDMWGTTANIHLSSTGACLAHISRKLISVKDAVTDKQTYTVMIAPGVDSSLIAAICICFDEAENEEEDK